MDGRKLAAGLLDTVLANPYHFKRNGIYYLRLRARGATSDAVTISLRTSVREVALRVTKDILKCLAAFHFENPSATWKQIKVQLDAIAPECVAKAQGDVSIAAYGDAHEEAISSNGFDKPESQGKASTGESACETPPTGRRLEKVPVFDAPRFGIPLSRLRFSVTVVSGTNKSGILMLHPQAFEFKLGRDPSGKDVNALWYSIDGDLLTVTEDSFPKGAPEEQWDEMLTNILEVQGCTKFPDRITPAPPPGKQREEWNATRMARVDELLISFTERLKLKERTKFVFKMADVTGPIESTLMKAGDKAWRQASEPSDSDAPMRG